jgi:hypothetical protein
VFKVALLAYLLRLYVFYVSINFELMKFTVSFITNVFQERDISESAEFISSVFKEDVCELLLEIVNLQIDLSLKRRVNDANF